MHDHTKILKDYKFGSTAFENEEISDKQNIIKNAFCDHDDHLEQIINDKKFLIIGRKGSGKTCYANKICSEVALKDSQSCGEVVNFNRIKRNYNIESSPPKTDRWDLLLTRELLLFLIVHGYISEEKNYNDINHIFSKYKVLPIDAKSIGIKIKNSMYNLASGNVEATISLSAVFKVRFGLSMLKKRQKTMEASEVIKRIENHIADKIQAQGNKVMIYDDLDDLGETKEGLNSLIDLIQLVDQKNEYFSTVNIKIVILMRSEVLANAVRNNLTKILNDKSINIDWNQDQLSHFTEKRLRLNGLQEATFSKNWQVLFPSKIKITQSYFHENGDITKNIRINSWLHLLTYTRYKPRDIIAFFKQSQNEFRHKEKLNSKDFGIVIAEYCRNYFYLELKEELQYFLETTMYETALNILFSEISSIEFNKALFINIASEIGLRDNKKIDRMFNIMVSLGCIGIKEINLDNEIVWVYSYTHNKRAFILEDGQKYKLHNAFQAIAREPKT